MKEHTCRKTTALSLRGMLDRMDSENRTYAKITSTRRIEKERVDSIALREAFINAIVHNDYLKGVPLVEIYEDRIVITSCGGLVDGLSENDFFKCRSMPRNRELMRVFRDMELVEQIGSGMTRILKAYDRSIFELTPGFTIVTLPFKNGFIMSNDDLKDDLNDEINANDKIKDDLNDEIKSTLDAIKRNPSATMLELAKLTGKSKTTIYRELKEFRTKGQLYREGSRKKGKWVVT